MKKYYLFLYLNLVALLSEAQLSTFDYYREINPVTKSGFYKMKIGSAIIDRPGYYRIFEVNDQDTMEVPHIAEEYDNSTYDKSFFRYLNIIDKSYTQNNKSFATLIIDSGLHYNSVYLNFNAPEFFKNVTLEGSDDNKNWKTIIENEKVFHYFRPPSDHYYRNKISFDSVSFRYLRVTCDDLGSQRLDLSSAYIPLTEEVSNGDGELLPTGLIRTEDKANKQTVIECSFRRMYFIACIQLKVENELPYRREVEVEFLTQNTSNDKWVVFSNGIISSNSSNKIYFQNYSLRDANFKTIKMRVIIHNLDDRPLGKIAIDAYTHEEIVKCRLEKEKKYLLAYGKMNDGAPQYDLQYFKNAIPLNVSYIEAGAEQKIVHATPIVKSPFISNKLWIWIVLVAGIILIGWFTVKMMKQEQSKE